MNKREFLKGSAATAAAMMTTALPEPDALADAMIPRTNWSGNYHYSTNRVFQPATISEVQDAIRSVAGVRALGTRHSFNDIADSKIAQISTLNLTDVSLDAKTRTATVGAGIRYGDLAIILDGKGFALHNMASLPHISVGGACSTATHGSGMRNGNLATAVTSIQFVAADGAVHSLSHDKDRGRFAGAVVALGSLGVVTHLTLAVQPRYEMTQIVYQNLPFSELEHHLADIMGAGYSVSIFTDWQNGRAGEVWIKRRVDQGGASTLPVHFYNATLATEKLHPIPGHSPDARTDQLNIVGPWYERLPHFKMNFTPSSGHELQTEFFVPFDRGYQAIRAVETLRDSITPHLYITELRAIAADNLWMSMAYQRPSLAIHFTWKLETDAVMNLLPQIEAKLAPYGARPHWAKVFAMNTRQIAPLYPRIQDFRALTQEFDPKGKFRNRYIRNHIDTDE
ncbi:MAG: D-arabinono-1,4-lactone oxidase [Acidobacteriaceae bacterium]